MRKTILLTLSLAFLGMLPAMAQLGKVLDDFQGYASDLGQYLQLRPELIPPLPNDAVPLSNENAIDYNTPFYSVPGSSEPIKMMPDPISAEDYFRSRIPEEMSNPLLPLNNNPFVQLTSGTFENNPFVQLTTSNEINRQIARGVAAGVLGQGGQQRSRIKLDNVEDTIQRIEQDVKEVEDSQSDLFRKFVGVLCDTLSEVPGPGGAISEQQQCRQTKQASTQLQILKVQRDQAKMMGETLASTIQGNQSLQYSNLNLASISQQIEETNRARRVDASAEAARLLKVTSQADLLANQDSEVTTQE